jgi:ribosomal protein S18 acetylase RimI-like enzyme
MPQLRVRTISPAEDSSAIDTIMLAFAADPMARWCWPEPHAYVTHMRPFVRAFSIAGFARGGAFCTDGFIGAALWLPPGTEPDEATMGRIFETTTPPTISKDVIAVTDRMAKHHPSEPHWHLPLIGVDPAYQSRGHGDALMQYAFERIDAERLPAYLESTNPRNIPFYERHGFEPLATIQLGTSPTIVPMLRKAR